MSEIDISHKFQPLFEIIEDESIFKDVDTIILTGGRASSKSFTVALFSLIGVVQNQWKVLYSRFTNTSIGDSIKTEVSDKIELLGYESLLTDNQYSIKANNGSGSISFKGIKTGSKGQTANLKSLTGFNIFVVDEAEEIPSYETFKKVFYSIRSVDKRNLSILILNPTTKEHWIYQKFFEKTSVPDGFCGIVDNVMFIHSSYLDVNPKFIPENIRKDYERLKIDNPNEYDNVVLGGWISEKEGVLFSRKSLMYYDELPEKIDSKICAIDIADTGTDSHCAVMGYLVGEKIYIEDVLFTKLGTEQNVDLTAGLISLHNPNYCRIEVNMGGTMYPQLLTPKIPKSTILLPVRERSNKITRIYTNAGFIKKFCVFKKEIQHGSDYYHFMNELCSYMADGSSEHDDAPDGLTGLIVTFKTFYQHLWQ